VQIAASYARKIFVSGLKLSGRPGQAAANGLFTQASGQKKSLAKDFSRAEMYQ